MDIATVNVGIAGQHIRSMQHRGMKMRESLRRRSGRRTSTSWWRRPIGW